MNSRINLPSKLPKKIDIDSTLHKVLELSQGLCIAIVRQNGHLHKFTGITSNFAKTGSEILEAASSIIQQNQLKPEKSKPIFIPITNTNYSILCFYVSSDFNSIIITNNQPTPNQIQEIENNFNLISKSFSQSSYTADKQAIEGSVNFLFRE